MKVGVVAFIFFVGEGVSGGADTKPILRERDSDIHSKRTHTHTINIFQFFFSFNRKKKICCWFLFFVEKVETAYLKSSPVLGSLVFLARTFFAELTAFRLRMPPLLMAFNLSFDLILRFAPGGPLRRFTPTLRLP